MSASTKKFCFHAILVGIGGLMGVLSAPYFWFLFRQHEKTCANMILAASHGEFALYVSPSHDDFVLFRGHQPIVSEYLDVDGLPERALYSPYRHESYNDIIYSTKFSKSDKVHIKERYAFDQCPDTRRNYIYNDTNGDVFFDSLRISLDDKTLCSWDFSFQDDEIHVVPQ